MSDISVPQTFMSQDQKSFVDPDFLSDKWLIGRQQAQRTIQVTTQRGICSAVFPLSRWYRANRIQQHKRLNIPLTSQGINILFETRIPTQQNLMIVHMLILHQIQNGIPQKLGFLMLQMTLNIFMDYSVLP